MKDKKITGAVTVLTMGCRVNQFETDLILEMGNDHGFCTTHSLEEADVIVVNTCSVTRESERQARKLVRRLVREHPAARLVITGCYAQRSPETFANHPNVELVVGNADKKQLWDLWSRHLRQEVLDCTTTLAGGDSGVHGGGIALQGPLLEHSPDRARTLLQIQDGCDRQCTYCLIPRVRGPGLSMDPGRVLSQAQRFLASGSRELVLLGIDIGSYGRELSPPSSLAEMVDALLPLCTEARLRLSSVDPMDLDDRLLERFHPGSPLCPHLHLSIQSGDDLVRKRMGRHGSRQEILDRIHRLRHINPGIVLGADLIAGFPTESEEAFGNTLDLVEAGGLTLLHVFPYSRRPDTPAAHFPSRVHLSEQTIRQRAAALRHMGKEMFRRRIEERLLRTADVLVERLDGGDAWGTSEDYQTVRFANLLGDPHGSIRRVRLTGYDPVAESFSGVVPSFSTGLSTASVDNS
ncbi:MAG: tRNA (N(6)-L-threonylcarbamoyladenosine(37)-C(2))-methylthiotransferase MtaB [Magnetococcales bacterium]|nr:tRNA (N(6)-L-threonylcarbamoyladenosine(37)-C(2))-methylthiotransferase MtaB [Magnetococcales bacterium]MBF0346516.1 tRNA (N(6)-L-threonylcarbamoyladenosine(37)-C(2))-methylthiotransferase MtaB [Magnetococcales bacterium]